MSADLKHFYLDATVFKDRVEEVHYISDPARNVRRHRQIRVWQVERFLGRGGFGEVRLERNQEDGQQVRAVKRIATTSAALSHSECEKELKALLEFSKPKFREAAVFVDFFGWFKDGNEIFLAMEYLHLGDLEKNIAAHSGKIPENEAQDIAEQLLSGLEIMHGESFAHRDLKPQNVLVVNGPPKWWVKLADFGLSKRLTDTTAYYTRGGTQLYMAPELLSLLDWDESSSTYTNAVDIWSMGCIVYRLVTGVVPFPPGTSLMKYCEDKSLFPYDALFDKSSIKSDGVKFLQQLLMPHPNKRPSASQALKHNWILSGSGIRNISPELSHQPDPKDSSGVSNPTVSKVAFNMSPRAGLQSQLSNETLSEIDFNTFPHAGLQTHQSSPPSSSQTALPPRPTPENSLPSSEATITPYPVRSKAAIQRSVSPTLIERREDQRATPTEKILAASSTPEPPVKVISESSKAIHGRPRSSAADKPYKKKVSLKDWWVQFLKANHSNDNHSNDDHSNDESLSPDRKLVSASGNYTVKHILEGHSDSVWDVAFSPDGKLIASGSSDKTIQLWDTATGAAQRTLRGHKNLVWGVAFSPDGEFIASGSSDMTVRLWDTATGAICCALEGHTSLVRSVAFSPDEKIIASGSSDKTVRLWDTATGAQRIFEGHTAPVSKVIFSPNGKLLASGSSDMTVRLWNTATGATQRVLKGHTGYVGSIAFSPDGRLASASTDMTVRIWDKATGLAQILEGHTGVVCVVAFSPDGIVSASHDGTVRVWHTATGATSRALGDDTSLVRSIAFSPDGKLIASGFGDRAVRIWEIPTGEQS